MRYLFIIIFLCSCSYEVSNPVMPLRDYTVNTGKTYYIKGDASVEDIINVINKNWHSRRQYKVIPLEGDYSLLKNIADAITNFLWVDLDLINMSITDLPENIFTNKNIRSLKLSDKVTTIKQGALSNCQQLDTIRLSNQPTTIEANAFANLTVENLQWNKKERFTFYVSPTMYSNTLLYLPNVSNIRQQGWSDISNVFSNVFFNQSL